MYYKIMSLEWILNVENSGLRPFPPSSCLLSRLVFYFLIDKMYPPCLVSRVDMSCVGYSYLCVLHVPCSRVMWLNLYVMPRIVSIWFIARRNMYQMVVARSKHRKGGTWIYSKTKILIFIDVWYNEWYAFKRPTYTILMRHTYSKGQNPTLWPLISMINLICVH